VSRSQPYPRLSRPQNLSVPALPRPSSFLAQTLVTIEHLQDLIAALGHAGNQELQVLVEGDALSSAWLEAGTGEQLT
jgi:hypothetical protein